MHGTLKRGMLILMLPLTILALLAGEACVLLSTWELDFTLSGHIRRWLDISTIKEMIGSILSWTLPVWAILMFVLILRQLHQEYRLIRGRLTAPYLQRSRRIQLIVGTLLTLVTLLNAFLFDQLMQMGWPVWLPGAFLLLRLIYALLHPYHGGKHNEQKK